MQNCTLFAQSRQRRFSRWLHNSRINVQRLYRPLIGVALSQWDETVMVLILDTTMLWEQYCVVRVSVRYRGRAVSLAWRVLAQASASVSFEEYHRLLWRVARLLPPGVRVRFLADSGLADTKLLPYLTQELEWHLLHSHQAKLLGMALWQGCLPTPAVASGTRRSAATPRGETHQNEPLRHGAFSTGA